MPLDFSNARYLGLHHASQELPAWHDLTTGFPAAFHESPGTMAAGQAIARLQGLEDGVVAPSSLHLFWDWFGLLNPRRDAVFADEQLYRVGAWGVERAAGRGVPVARFAHQSARSLQVFLEKKYPGNHRPVVVTDGWCPLCGRAAPLREYLALVELLGGWLVVDDTQALGILGMPGGGGLLRQLALQSERVISISSLAKAFGAPLAALCGSAAAVQAFRARSETRVFASPVSAAAVAAAQNVLKINAVHGDALRRKLLRNIRQFKFCLEQRGVATGGGTFPVQVLKNFSGEAARRLHGRLWRHGIRSVLSTGHDGEPVLCFLLNARQTETQVEQVCQAIFSSIGQSPVSTFPTEVGTDRTGAPVKFY